MREKLAELIADARSEYYDYSDELHEKGMSVPESSEEYIADYLIANGVVVLPCKIGDVVYALWSVPTEAKHIIYCAEVKKISQYKKNCRLTTFFEIEPIEFRGRIKEYQIDDFGKTVFLNREDAERALKGEKG